MSYEVIYEKPQTDLERVITYQEQLRRENSASSLGDIAVAGCLILGALGPHTGAIAPNTVTTAPDLGLTPVIKEAEAIAISAEFSSAAFRSR